MSANLEEASWRLRLGYFNFMFYGLGIWVITLIDTTILSIRGFYQVYFVGLIHIKLLCRLPEFLAINRLIKVYCIIHALSIFWKISLTKMSGWWAFPLVLVAQLVKLLLLYHLQLIHVDWLVVSTIHRVFFRKNRAAWCIGNRKRDCGSILITAKILILIWNLALRFDETRWQVLAGSIGQTLVPCSLISSLSFLFAQFQSFLSLILTR